MEKHAINPWAGECTLILNGTPRVLKLTLGSLAQMEQALSNGSLVELVERFESGVFSAQDVQAVIIAGLRGGGWRGEASTLLDAEIAGGPLEATRIAAQLLVRAFASPAALSAGAAQ
ncbi:MAG: gene transfer agent family protein [Rhodobacteraceae bacterium]|nr:gene transfer agent family protein [Paracoccaceae bacterium]